ncbi:MAG: acyl carrier protein [Spirochaetaceae bacterium]|nr:acyl carrier protein [Myxococcales bacterium]MCB9725357.1 acyl carrier protein [Spirochaetaceae bacterium]HPG28003.1 acyl carrier protein [Myxococcota bacterium]
MSDAAQIQAIVKDFVLAEFLEGEDPSELKDDTELVTTGILDSLATLKLVTYIEEQFEVEIDADEADETHLNTLADIVRLIQSKR